MSNIVGELTPRETEVLKFIKVGATSKEIAKLLSTTEHSVNWTVKTLMFKLHARNRVHLAAMPDNGSGK